MSYHYFLLSMSLEVGTTLGPVLETAESTWGTRPNSSTYQWLGRITCFSVSLRQYLPHKVVARNKRSWPPDVGQYLARARFPEASSLWPKFRREFAPTDNCWVLETFWTVPKYSARGCPKDTREMMWNYDYVKKTSVLGISVIESSVLSAGTRTWAFPK